LHSISCKDLRLSILPSSKTTELPEHSLAPPGLATAPEAPATAARDEHDDDDDDDDDGDDGDDDDTNNANDLWQK